MRALQDLQGRATSLSGAGPATPRNRRRHRFDDQAHLWFCDIALDTEAAYFPFGRLALVRYRPGSIDV